MLATLDRISLVYTIKNSSIEQGYLIMVVGIMSSMKLYTSNIKQTNTLCYYNKDLSTKEIMKLLKKQKNKNEQS